MTGLYGIGKVPDIIYFGQLISIALLIRSVYPTRVTVKGKFGKLGSQFFLFLIHVLKSYIRIDIHVIFIVLNRCKLCLDVF